MKNVKKIISTDMEMETHNRVGKISVVYDVVKGMNTHAHRYPEVGRRIYWT